MALSQPESLTAGHDVAAFSCGNQFLDDWLKTRALLNQEKGFSAVIVVHEAGRVVGYYDSAPTSVLAAADLHRMKINRRSGSEAFGRGPIPCLLLGQLATDSSWTSRGISTALLTHALQRCVLAARLTGAPAVVVRAPDGRAGAFWTRRGFLASKDDPLVLFRSIPDIAASLDVAGVALAA